MSPAQAVGAALQGARAIRGASLDSVCRHTRIPRRYIEALEAGRFEELPAPVYLRSFLADYCEFLELELEPLWRQMNPPLAPSSHREPEQLECPDTEPLEASAYLESLRSSWGAVLCSLILAAVLAWRVAREPRSGPEEAQKPQVLWPLRPALEEKLSIMVRDEAWIILEADDSAIFAGRAPKNARIDGVAHKSLRLRAFPSENLELTFNGAPYRLPPPDADGGYRIGNP